MMPARTFPAVLLLSVLFVAVGSGCDGKADLAPSKPAVATKTDPVAVPELPVECRLAAARPVAGTESGMVPRFSPDGREVLFTGAKFRGLRVVDLETGAVRLLSEQGPLGYLARWEGTDVVSARSKGSAEVRFGRNGTRHEDGVFPDSTRVAIDGCRYRQIDDVIWCDRGDDRTAATVGDDKFYRPQLSPDGRKLIYQGLATGIHMRYVGSGRTISVGPGNHPAWFADSRRIVFDLSLDDGLDILSADLFMYDLRDGRRRQLTHTEDVIEMHPSPSPDGTAIAFDAGMKIHIGNLSCRP